MFATTFPVTVLTLAIPTIADDFGVAEAELSWLITLPVLCSALALPVLGKLGDLYGHRRIFIAGFAVALVTTALTATATTPVALIAVADAHPGGGRQHVAQLAGAHQLGAPRRGPGPGDGLVVDDRGGRTRRRADHRGGRDRRGRLADAVPRCSPG